MKNYAQNKKTSKQVDPLILSTSVNKQTAVIRKQEATALSKSGILFIVHEIHVKVVNKNMALNYVSHYNLKNGK